MSVNREIEVGANDYTLDKHAMTLGTRIDERRIAIGISQAELARRVGMRQSTMNSLINGDSRSSRKIVQIARELRTTPAYLTGAADDPDENAPAMPAALPVQYVTLQVVLPNEEALAAMYEAQLRIYSDLHGVELARALAKRLPNGLARLRGAQLTQETVAADDRPVAEPPQNEGRVELQRARRK